MIIRAAHPSHFDWLVKRADFSGYSPKFRAIEAAHEDGTILGMVGFDGWTDNSCVASFALDTPIALRGLMGPAFEFVFDVAKRGLILCTVRGSNAKSLRVCKHLGFKETYRVRDAVAVGEDLVVFEMRREECRYLKRERKAA